MAKSKPAAERKPGPARTGPDTPAEHPTAGDFFSAETPPPPTSPPPPATPLPPGTRSSPERATNLPPAAPLSPPTPVPEYTVLARRYRPQQFADLIGQEPVARALTNALRANRVAHAYLFTGARGVGKTSAARILAKALNCVAGPTPTPCDRCDSCLRIATGEDIDVLEIDGASNRRIDEIRDIRDNVQYRPSRSRYKIYIIDEVHMLTREAFNALLKTLEEPPGHIKFVFATTEVQKIPVTILSRCQRFDFSGIGVRGIVDRLRGIIAAEHREADDDALEQVARRAGGSMRDAQSLLDQLLAFGGDRLSLDQVHRLLGTASDERLLDLVDAVLTQNTPAALAMTAEALDAGLQPGEIVDQLIDFWRDLMVLASGGGTLSLLSVSDRHREQLAARAKTVSLDTILAGLDVLASTKARLRVSTHARVLVEMALVRLGRLGNLASLSQLTLWLAGGGEAPAVPAGATLPRALPGISSSASSGSAPPASRLTPATAVPPEPAEGEAGKKKRHPAAEPARYDPVNVVDWLPEVWPVVLAKAGLKLVVDLRNSGLPAISGPNSLAITLPAAYTTSSVTAEVRDGIGKIEEAIRHLTGASWSIQIHTRAPGLTETAPRHHAQPDDGPVLSMNDLAQQVPLLKRAVDLFGARILKRDPGFGTATAPPPKPPADFGSEEET